jgi:hypothetical protein
MDDPRRRDDPGPAPATGFDRRSVVMLDRLVDRYAPRAWPVTAVLEPGADPASGVQHDGSPPTLLPRSDWTATPTAATSVLDVRTGRTVPARVFRMERREDV